MSKITIRKRSTSKSRRKSRFGLSTSITHLPMVTESIPDKLLQDIPLFRTLNPTERRQLAEVIQIKVSKPGDLILEQGKECRNLWIVVEGKCEVVRHIDHKESEKESVVLATIEPY